MTDRYAVFGHPIAHSKSPLIHATFADATRQDLTYEAIDAPVGGFAAAVDAFRAGSGRGANVTAPFKLDAFAYATDATERARLAGAVNALKFEGERVWAENFDGVGLVHDIEANLGFPLRGARVLLLGAGGATRGATAPILACGPANVTVANRDLAKAEALGAQFAEFGPIDPVAYEALASLPPFDVVVNATSASWDGALPPAPRACFSAGGLAYEMVYGRGSTPFLALAKSAGVARLADGVGMLVEQAAEAFAWWRGVRPDTRAAIEKLTVPIG